jgi:hypothetical protein
VSFIVLWTGSEYYRILAPISAEPRIAVECESASSLIMQVEAGRSIAPAAKGEVTPASEKVCEIFGAHISS